MTCVKLEVFWTLRCLHQPCVRCRTSTQSARGCTVAVGPRASMYGALKPVRTAYDDAFCTYVKKSIEIKSIIDLPSSVLSVSYRFALAIFQPWWSFTQETGALAGITHGVQCQGTRGVENTPAINNTCAAMQGASEKFLSLLRNILIVFLSEYLYVQSLAIGMALVVSIIMSFSSGYCMSYIHIFQYIMSFCATSLSRRTT